MHSPALLGPRCDMSMLTCWLHGTRAVNAMHVACDKRHGLGRFGSASAPGTGQGVTVYTIDSGVRATHQEFMPWAGSASRASYGCAPILGPQSPGMRAFQQNWVTINVQFSSREVFMKWNRHASAADMQGGLGLYPNMKTLD